MSHKISTVCGLFAALMLSSTGVYASVGPNGFDHATAATNQQSVEIMQLARRGRGKDDGQNHAAIKGDDSQQFARRGRGKDDGPNHAAIKGDNSLQFARRGADDGAGHVRGGKDDGPNHG